MAVSVLGWSHNEFWHATPRCLLSQIGIKTGKRTDGSESVPVATKQDLADMMAW